MRKLLSSSAVLRTAVCPTAIPAATHKATPVHPAFPSPQAPIRRKCGVEQQGIKIGRNGGDADVDINNRNVLNTAVAKMRQFPASSRT
jgi:hypothetical protein